jgi:hypothetical protein
MSQAGVSSFFESGSFASSSAKEMKIVEKLARRARALAQRYGKGVSHVIAKDCNPKGLQWQDRILE